MREPGVGLSAARRGSFVSAPAVLFDCRASCGGGSRATFALAQPGHAAVHETAGGWLGTRGRSRRELRRESLENPGCGDGRYAWKIVGRTAGRSATAI